MKTTQYSIEGFDSFSNEAFPVGVYESYEKAVEVANEQGGVMTLMYVRDPNGKIVHTAGTW